MAFFFKEQRYNSPINGELVLRRYIRGRWFLKTSGGEYQSGTYLEKTWQVIFEKYQGKGSNPKNVLVLGAGAGCAIHKINKIWNPKSIEAIDYDPVIVGIGEKIYKNIRSNTKFIISDAANFVRECQKKYDLIVVDLFCGNYPSSLLKDSGFIFNINRILKGPGLVIVNYAAELSGHDQEIPKSWQAVFPELIEMNCGGNKLLGIEASKIPIDYYNIQQDQAWARFLEKRGWKILGEPRSFTYIQRLPLNLCVANAIHTDSEPQIGAIKKAGCCHGIAFWTPWEKRSAPRGWKRWPGFLAVLHTKGNGFSEVSKDFKEKWSERPKRALKKFQNSKIEIELSDPETFIKGLKKSTLKKSLQKSFISMIKGMEHAPLIFWIAKNEKEISGGLAIINYQNISCHFAAYVAKTGKGVQAGTGLINHWYEYCLRNNVKYLNFGHVWQKGEPKSWRGYSSFKKNFIEREINLTGGYFKIF